MDIEQIERLAKLKGDGLITEQEFADAKAKVLGLGGSSSAAQVGAAVTRATAGQSVSRTAIIAPKWEKRFAFFDKVGSPFSREASAASRDLKFGERAGIFFNIWAMLFGVIYFIILGIPKRGIVILAISVAVAMALWGVETFVDYSPNWYWFVVWAIYGGTANYYYYIKVRYGRDEWNPAKDLFS